MFRIILFLSLFISAFSQGAAVWPSYPKTLPVFDFSGDKLKQNWHKIAKVTYLPYPDAKFILNELKQRPNLYKKIKQEGSQANAHPALKALASGNAEPLALALQDIWRDHFSGRFQQAYNKGMKLGLLGNIPALHAKLITAVLLVKDKQQKLDMLKSVEKIISQNAELSEGMPFVIFGQNYARMRILELLSTSDATATGYVSASKASTQKLQKQFPKRAIYPAMIGGMYAGIVERVGSFLGSISYGATESKAIKELEQAVKFEQNLPVIYNEYALALMRMDKDAHKKRITTLLKQCLKLVPVNAEEALNRQQCQSKLASLKKS